jgi:hypothetical protein
MHRVRGPKNVALSSYYEAHPSYFRACLDQEQAGKEILMILGEFSQHGGCVLLVHNPYINWCGSRGRDAGRALSHWGKADYVEEKPLLLAAIAVTITMAFLCGCQSDKQGDLKGDLARQRPRRKRRRPSRRVRRRAESSALHDRSSGRKSRRSWAPHSIATPSGDISRSILPTVAPCARWVPRNACTSRALRRSTSAVTISTKETPSDRNAPRGTPAFSGLTGEKT